MHMYSSGTEKLPFSLAGDPAGNQASTKDLGNKVNLEIQKTDPQKLGLKRRTERRNTSGMACGVGW